MTESQLKLYDRLINKPSNDWEIYYWATGESLRSIILTPRPCLVVSLVGGIFMSPFSAVGSSIIENKKNIKVLLHLPRAEPVVLFQYVTSQTSCHDVT